MRLNAACKAPWTARLSRQPGLSAVQQRTQIANAQNDAALFVKLNYPSTYFFSSDVTVTPTTDVTVDLSQTHFRIVTVECAHHPTLDITKCWVLGPRRSPRPEGFAADVNIPNGGRAGPDRWRPAVLRGAEAAAINFVINSRMAAITRIW